MAVELATAYISIVPETSKIAPGVNKALGGVEKDADSKGQSWGSKLAGGIGKTMKAGAVVAGGAVAGVLGTALVKGFGRLNAIDQAQAKLRGLGHSADGVKGIMDNALASVKGTAFGLGDAATVAASTVAAGIKPGKQLERVLKLTGDTATIAGSSIGEMGSIFNKVAASNRLSMAEVNQLSDRGVPIMQMLAEQYGVTAGEARKMVERGEVDFPAFSKAIEDNIGGAALESGNTFQGAFANMGAALGRVGASLLGGIFPQIKDGFGGLTEVLDGLGPTAEKVGKTLGDWLGRGAAAVTLFIAEFKAGEGTGGSFRDTFERVRSVVENVFGFIRDTAIPILKALWDWISDNKETVAAFVVAIGTMLVINKVVKAVKAFNLALSMNPIGLIILAIAALVAGLVWLYNNNETARKIIDAAWAAIKTAISAVVDWLTGTAWPFIKGVWDKISSGAKWLWENAIKPAWDGIKGAISAVVSWLTDTAWPFVKGVFDKIGEAVKFLYENFIRPQWSLMKIIIDEVVQWLRNTAWPWIKDVWDKISAGVTWLYENAIKPAWDNIKSGIDKVATWLRDTVWPIVKDVWDKIAAGASWLWENGIKPAFGYIKDGVDTVVEAFGKAKDAIGTVWGKITDAISGPLNAAKAFINDKFIKPLNSMFEKLQMTFRIPLIGGGTSGAKGVASSGGSARAFASGGVVPGYSPHPRADNIPAWLTAGEYVLPVNSTRRLMGQVGAGGLEMLRRGVIPGYADGGLVGWIKQRGTDIIDLASQAWKILQDPAGALKSFADNALASLGSQPLVQAAGAAVRKIIDAVVSKIREFAASGMGGGGGTASGGGMGWAAMEAWFKSQFPGMNITSGYRPGARSVTGVVSDHALGRAIDMPPSMAIFNAIDRTWGNIRQLLYSPAGGRQIRGYRRSDTSGALRAQHYNHVHWAMADGGLVKPFVADSGVTLAPGINVLDNRTGGPEPLGRTDQPIRLHPDNVRELAAAVERGAYRGVSEIGRGLALSGGRY